MPVGHGHSTGETKANSNQITALSITETPIQLKESKELEKRILPTSQMEEVSESLRYPKSVESVSEDQVTQEQMELSDDNSRTIEVKEVEESLCLLPIPQFDAIIGTGLATSRAGPSLRSAR